MFARYFTSTGISRCSGRPVLVSATGLRSRKSARNSSVPTFTSLWTWLSRPMRDTV